MRRRQLLRIANFMRNKLAYQKPLQDSWWELFVKATNTVIKGGRKNG